MFKIRNKTRGTQKKVWFKTPHFKLTFQISLPGAGTFVKHALATFINIKKAYYKKTTKEYGEEKHIIFIQTRLPRNHQINYL